jgi:hypothetical protein
MVLLEHTLAAFSMKGPNQIRTRSAPGRDTDGAIFSILKGLIDFGVNCFISSERPPLAVCLDSCIQSALSFVQRFWSRRT